MSLQRHWKDAATLLLVAKLPKYERGFNYKILLMKRSATSKFMANAAVFPGGTSDKADFSVQWEPQLLKFKRPTESLLAKFSRPPMFKSPEFDGLSPELGFRICAVRETFEEAGVPLFKTAGGSDLNPAEGPNDVVKQIGQHVLAEWRKKVQEDGSQFIKMCAELQLVPDIWSLKTWSNWLTPTHMQSQHGKSSRRFDTVFYTCCLPYVPEYFHDDTEIISSEWQCPAESLRMSCREEIWLAPPQLYELSRLYGLKDFDEVNNYSVEREKDGCERWFPVRFNCQDGIITTLVGDSLYPRSPDFAGENGVTDLEQTMQESRESTATLHRLEFKSKYDVDIHCTLELPFNQLSALPGQEYKEELKGTHS